MNLIRYLLVSIDMIEKNKVNDSEDKNIKNRNNIVEICLSLAFIILVL